MVEISDSSRHDAHLSGAGMSAPGVREWFVREVLPLEAALMQYLQHNWRNRSDIADLRQEVYVRVFDAAKKEIPRRPRQFVFATARNLLINRIRDEAVVPIEAVADLDALNVAKDEPGPERTVSARDELRHLQSALDRLPPRCREAVILGRIEELPRREIASRMGVSEDTVTEHIAKGMRVLADILYGAPADLRRQK
ncbi:MAG TPA: RNA polymerase sigma factor [Rhizomicrobium sp.]|nr:RNA polymerase sigma factor [Rhizomicrobium sp.]